MAKPLFRKLFSPRVTNMIWKGGPAQVDDPTPPKSDQWAGAGAPTSPASTDAQSGPASSAPSSTGLKQAAAQKNAPPDSKGTPTAKGSDPNWIEHANLHKGAFTKKANAAGKSVSEMAHDKAGAPGKTGKQARLALSLKGLHNAARQ